MEFRMFHYGRIAIVALPLLVLLGQDECSSSDDPLAEATPPPEPSFPETINTLTVSVMTGALPEDGTDENSLSLCLTEDDCYAFALPDVDDYLPGVTDVYQFEGIALPRALIDRVELRSQGGVDDWRPACMQLSFDGEPVYCNDELGVVLGESGVESYTDQQGLHLSCISCYQEVLSHGPLVGAAGPDRVNIWARSDATRTLGLRMSTSRELDEASTVAWLQSGPDSDFSQTLSVQGLQADTRYYYDFVNNGQLVSANNLSFKTAPESGAATTLRFAFGSCTKSEEQPLLSVISNLEPDLFAFIGDNHYGNTNHIGALRWHYREMREIPARKALVGNTPILATWDDHDYVGNNTDGTAEGKENALAVFHDYWANPPVLGSNLPGTFTQYSYGDIDFFMLDSRYWRGFENSLLGTEQSEWLMQSLLESSATFKLLLLGSQWTAYGSSDSWASFLPARDALFDFIRDNNINGVVLLSGDVHRSEMRLIDRSAAGSYDLPELTSSPLSNSNSSCGSDEELIACFDNGPLFMYLDIDTTAEDPSLSANIVNVSGSVLHSWTLYSSLLRNP